MRALAFAGAFVATAGLVLAGCSHEKKSHEEGGVTVDERGAGGPGGGSSGTTGVETDKVGHLEGTIQKVERDKFLVGILPERGVSGESKIDRSDSSMGSGEGSNLMFVSLEGAEIYDDSGNKIDTTNREKLFGESGQLSVGKKISCDYSGVDKQDVAGTGAGGERKLVYHARRVNLLRGGR
jgi:hypothetical protein